MPVVAPTDSYVSVFWRWGWVKWHKLGRICGQDVAKGVQDLSIGSLPKMNGTIDGRTKMSTDVHVSVSLGALQKELDKGSPGGMEGRLFSHAKSGNWDGLQLLLAAKVDVNNPHNESGKTALMAAAMNGHPDSIILLLEAGADVNAQDTNGETALMGAALNGQPACVKLLIEAGADINTQDEDGETSLMKAVSPDGHRSLKPARVACAKLLIEAGADVNAKDRAGSTALNRAQYSHYGYKDCVLPLKLAGAIEAPERI
jgi:ankyrin repeat protein